MFKVIKKGIPYVIAIILSVAIMFVVNFANKYQIAPISIYKVYLDGKSIGNIKDKNELEDYINDEQKDIKDKYNVNKVYIPSGVNIQKCNTYEKEILTAKQVHNLIKEEKPFTVKGYKIKIKPIMKLDGVGDEVKAEKYSYSGSLVFDKSIFKYIK